MKNRIAFILGAATQGTVLGILLWEAILAARMVEEGAQLFRYQGF